MHIDVKDKKPEGDGKKLDMTAIGQWLSSEITVKLPGWALAAGGLFMLLLLAIALD